MSDNDFAVDGLAAAVCGPDSGFLLIIRRPIVRLSPFPRCGVGPGLQWGDERRGIAVPEDGGLFANPASKSMHAVHAKEVGIYQLPHAV